MILWYKNSFLASVISILGSIIALGGIASFGSSLRRAIHRGLCLLTALSSLLASLGHLRRR